MRTLFLVILMVTLGAHPVIESRKWAIDPTSYLVINGSTNVNTFTCRTDCYNLFDTLEYVVQDKSCGITFLKNEMIVPVINFSCGNDLITNDFWQTLNASQHPTMVIRFLSLDDSNLLQHGNAVTGEVRITLAGVTKAFRINYTVKGDAEQAFSLTGHRVLCFSDFNLKAPRKMLGLIQVQEDLEVEFHLLLKAV